MKFDSEPDYDLLINLMRELTIYDKNGKYVRTRTIEDYELNEISWNLYITGFHSAKFDRFAAVKW